MSHIIIQNQNELPVWGLRLLGLSNKNEAQIGRFGTGLKESIALLIRRGISLIIYSGTCRIDLQVQEIDGQQEICFSLSEKRDRFEAGQWYGLGMHPNFGHHDWNDLWMVFRELLCNGIDEGGLYHDVLSGEPTGVAGCTRVYLPCVPETLTAYTESLERILLLHPEKQPLVENQYGKVLAKGRHSKLQVFHRGIWVQSHNDRESIFDYDIPSLRLSESRTADWWSVGYAVGKILSGLNEASIKVMLPTILENKNVFERAVVEYTREFMGPEERNAYCNAFTAVYGDAVITNSELFFFERLREQGHRPLVVECEGLFDVLRKSGVPTYASVLSSEDQEFSKIEEPTSACQERFDTVWGKFRSLGITGDRAKPPLRMFQQSKAASGYVLGCHRKGICYVNRDCVGSEQERLVHLEEICHYLSDGAQDMTREFQNFIFECLGVSLGL